MKRHMLWVGLVALVLCFSVAFLTGCAKQAGLKTEEAVTQEQRASTAQAPAEVAPAPAPSQVPRERTAPDQSLQQGQAAKPAPAQAAVDKAAAAKAAAAQAAAAALLTQLQIPDAHFDFDKYSLKPADQEMLKAKVPGYLKNKDYKLVVEGHCDERGTVEYNLALGQKRADEAAKYLSDLGMEKERIKTISYGKEMPLELGHDEAAWSANRRAHFVVFPPAK